ncbi:hypothetical protein ABK040_004952 [Willaertia magna]
MNEQKINKNDQNDFSFDYYILINVSVYNKMETDDDEDLFEEDLDLNEKDLLNKIDMHEQERENIVYNLKYYINNLDNNSVL